MEARKARELAARLLKVGEGRIYIDPVAESKVAEAMTNDDIRGLIAERAIKKRASKEQSLGRARFARAQRVKGRRRGAGNRSGTKKVRTHQKKEWINKVRSLRRTLKEIRARSPSAVEEKVYSNVYKKIKGNFFKGKKNLIEYVEGAKK
ncbi:MAG: 50S ribosomal protein L19e [archaeon]|jgi:large subunit ribosomal protein L19e